MKILLVDDEKEFVTALAERFSLRGIDADWVTRGKDAIKLARVKHYDVIVIDVRMPETSGLDVMESIRRTQPKMRFIFLTGHSSAESYRAYKDAGACDYLIKPVKIDVLIKKIFDAAQT